MGARSSLGLKFLQWFIRGVQFGCAAVVLALFSYFLATMHNHNMTIPNQVRAVEGISGFAVLYTLIGLLLLCCLAGHPFTSAIAILLDGCFAAAFIYVAVANKGGVGSCQGTVNTQFGEGDANSKPKENEDGFAALPTYGQACRMGSACVAVSIVVIFFFIFSVLVEITLVRARRQEARFGPSPANNYTSGYGRRGKFFGLFKRRQAAEDENPNILPAHTTPNELTHQNEPLVPSYNTESTAMGGHEGGYNKYGESGYHNDGRVAYPETGITHNAHGTAPQPAAHRYSDGVYNA